MSTKELAVSTVSPDELELASLKQNGQKKMNGHDDGGYTGDNIKVLEGLEAVRLRPAMYIGSTGEMGLHHLVYEVVDNSVVAALLGKCTEIAVTLHTDDSATIVDNGRGIPVKMHDEGVSAAEVVMTKLHAGGKFDSNTYKVSGGLHGVGVSCVNALSESLHLEIWREKATWEQDYERGIPLAPLKQTGKSNKTGTKITFKADPTIMMATTFDFDVLANRLRQMAFLNKGLKITLTDERTEGEPRVEVFHFAGGIAEFIRHPNRGKSVLHDKPIHFEGERDVANGKLYIEVALQYNDAYSETVFSFANNINTVDGGSHLSGFRSALTRTINYAGQ